MKVPDRIPEGTDARIDMQCSATTKQLLKQMMMEIDAEITYEQAIQTALHVYRLNPSKFQLAFEDMRRE